MLTYNNLWSKLKKNKKSKDYKILVSVKKIVAYMNENYTSIEVWDRKCDDHNEQLKIIFGWTALLSQISIECLFFFLINTDKKIIKQFFYIIQIFHTIIFLITITRMNIQLSQYEGGPKGKIWQPCLYDMNLKDLLIYQSKCDLFV